jgi:hypothetical protein
VHLAIPAGIDNAMMLTATARDSRFALHCSLTALATCALITAVPMHAGMRSKFGSFRDRSGATEEIVS